MLANKAIAYLNIDSAVFGNYTFQASAGPLLYESVWSATRRVVNPNAMEVQKGLTTVYEAYKTHRPSKASDEDGNRPHIDTPGAGSDFGPFINIGVPVADLMFDCDHTHIQCYPLYHTMYDTYEYVSQILDKGFLVRIPLNCSNILQQLLFSLVPESDGTDRGRNVAVTVGHTTAPDSRFHHILPAVHRESSL